MMPTSFVAISQSCPSILIGANYAQADNFTGEVVDGYRKMEVVVSKAVAEKLCLVQEQAQSQGLSLKIFDGYRPVKAVSFFQAWAQRPESNPEVKQRYYPTHTKEELFQLGYIANRSSHSRGGAVDLTLVNESTGVELDMGTIFDFFHDSSHTEHGSISASAQQNRQLLKRLMEANGFKNFSQEWWHYSLTQEPFPGQYFDFDIE